MSTTPYASPALDDFGIDAKLGFVGRIPVQTFAGSVFEESLCAVETCVRGLPRVLGSGSKQRVRAWLQDQLSDTPIVQEEEVDAMSEGELELAMLLYTMCVAAWMRPVPNGEPIDEEGLRVPRYLAVPCCAVADKLQRPPITSHVLTLANWRLMDDSAPVELGNVELLVPFAGGVDEAWFFVVPIVMEAQCGGRLARGALQCVEGMATQDKELLVAGLELVSEAIHDMQEIFAHMDDLCDPYVFFRRVRHFLGGYEEAVFEGAGKDGGDRSVSAHGASAAQSALFHVCDALLGVSHHGEAQEFLEAMRPFMRVGWRRFLEFLDEQEDVCDHALVTEDNEVRSAYEQCVETLVGFRSQHIRVVSKFVVVQSVKLRKDQGLADSDEGVKGTGGSSVMGFLKGSRDDTRSLVQAKSAEDGK